MSIARRLAVSALSKLRSFELAGRSSRSYYQTPRLSWSRSKRLLDYNIRLPRDAFPLASTRAERPPPIIGHTRVTSGDSSCRRRELISPEALRRRVAGLRLIYFRVAAPAGRAASLEEDGGGEMPAIEGVEADSSGRGPISAQHGVVARQLQLIGSTAGADIAAFAA